MEKTVIFKLKAMTAMKENHAKDPKFDILGKEVSIGAVDKELRLLWENDDANTNASLINLAVFSEQKDALFKNSEIVSEVTRDHACRAILIGTNRSEETASVRAWITAHCNLSGGKKSVCCEQIAFQLAGTAKGRLRNTVFAHLNSDLPLVFWWQGELSSIFSERLYNLIDRFVYDSAEWENTLESFKLIEQAIDDTGHFLPMDFEWTRSFQIRLAIACLFDDPMANRALEAISEVKIVVHPDHETAALQVLAWIMKRLDWSRSAELELGDTAGSQYHFESSEGVNITAAIELDHASAPVGLVEISSPDCTVRVSREAGSAYIFQELHAGDHHISSHTPANKDEPAELLKDQLSRGGKNTLYRSMLPAFIELLGG